LFNLNFNHNFNKTYINIKPTSTKKVLFIKQLFSNRNHKSYHNTKQKNHTSHSKMSKLTQRYQNSLAFSYTDYYWWPSLMSLNSDTNNIFIEVLVYLQNLFHFFFLFFYLSPLSLLNPIFPILQLQFKRIADDTYVSRIINIICNFLNCIISLYISCIVLFYQFLFYNA
jgi:hypothetical protein